MKSKKKTKFAKIFGFKYFFYDFVKWTGALPTLLFIRPSVHYMDKKAVKRLKGGFIASGNHMQYLDPIILLCTFPFRRMLFMAMEGMFNTPIKRFFFNAIRCVKVDRENVSVETIRQASEYLKDEKVLCIFPEGRISQSDGLEQFKPGCAMLSVLNDVPIVPVCIKKRNSIRRCTQIIVGKPIYARDVVGDQKSLNAIDAVNKKLFEVENELAEYIKKL